MARVLFINPVVREEDVPRHIPYGIAMLAAIARDAGHQVAVYDANAWRQPISKVADACKADDWDVIAIGGLTTTYGFIKQACMIAKQAAPQALLVAGGGLLTSMPAEVMEWIPQIDVGILGEAFRTFPDVLRDGYSDGMPGTITRRGLNEARPIVRDIDTLPWPAWEYFPLEEVYFKNSSALFSEEVYGCKRRIDINGSYGCSLVCRYCWHLGTTGDMQIAETADGTRDVVFSYGRNLRYHSAEYIGAMVRQLQNQYAVDFVTFLDENLMTMEASSGRKWLGQICDKLEPMGIKWAGTSHAGLHRPEILRRMRQAGCSHLVYGLESFDPHILKRLGKGTTREKNIESVGICQSAGIAPIPNIIIGFPEETFQSVRNTITALLELGIHCKPHFATAYPGSEWYYAYKHDITKQYGDLERYILDLGDATKITGTISQNFTGMELLGLQEIVARRDLRLLDLAEKAWLSRAPLTWPRQSFNFRAKREPGPIEP
jgi:anaerobic magnesium-protoporphyrin IX monomethyl ester cyclase